jgi:hypothetical protein
LERVATTEQAISKTPSAAQPYPPSWVDRLTNWVRRLPGPAWPLYLALGLLVFAVLTLIKWYDGTYAVGTFFVVHAVFAFTGFYLLALLHYLDDMTARALDEFRPVFVASDQSDPEAEFDLLRYQLTTMPAGRTLLWSLVGAGVMICVYLAYPLVLDPAQTRGGLLFTSPVAIAFETGVNIAQGMISGASIYHTVRQLSMVDYIYRHHTRIDLFRLGPLHAFSRLAAWTTFGYALLTTVWVVFWPGALDDLVSLGFMVFFASLAVATFVLPLLGIHELLVKEKERRKAEAGEQLNLAINELYQRNMARDYQQMVALNNATEALVRDRDVLEKIPTWPWQPETVRWLGTALLLPIILWLITRVLEGVLGF